MLILSVTTFTIVKTLKTYVERLHDMIFGLQVERTSSDVHKGDGCLCGLYVLPHKWVWIMPQRGKRVQESVSFGVSGRGKPQTNALNLLRPICNKRNLLFLHALVVEVCIWVWDATHLYGNRMFQGDAFQDNVACVLVIIADDQLYKVLVVRSTRLYFAFRCFVGV